MDTATRDFVRHRADERCEYCLMAQAQSKLKHHVEHIVAKKHGGSDEADNLALACHRCNLHKGPNLTGIDPQPGEIVRFFHLRRHRWSEHFFFDAARVDGVTAIGRARPGFE